MANLRRCGKFIFVARFAIVHMLQPVPEKMRLEMVIGMQNDILDGHHKSPFIRLIGNERDINCVAVCCNGLMGITSLFSYGSLETKETSTVLQCVATCSWASQVSFQVAHMKRFSAFSLCKRLFCLMKRLFCVCALTHIVRAQFICTAHGCAHCSIQLALLRVQGAIYCEYIALLRIIRDRSSSAARRCSLSRFTGLSCHI